MIRALALVVALGSAAPLSAAEDDAKAQAQTILDKGSAIFDRKDMAAMLATYTEDAQVFWTSKEENATEVRVETKKGRAEIESLYDGAFKETAKTTSKNVVEFARVIAPGLMVIHGTFQPDTSKSGIYPFVQVRVKQGDKWLIKSLQFFVFSQD